MTFRLNHNADDFVDIVHYYETRALQLASLGFKWSQTLDYTAHGFITYFIRDGIKFCSGYIPLRMRGQGHGVPLLKGANCSVVTMEDCNIISFLEKHNIPHYIARSVFDTIEYKMVQDFYGNDCAKRSGVLKMNHIDEGLYIMMKIDASLTAMKAYCIHPLLQNSMDLAANFDKVVMKCNPIAVALAMEYRNIANAYLSHRKIRSTFDIELSPLLGVDKMLIADKVQNYKDFLIYNAATHPRSREIDEYFNNWLVKLDVRDKFLGWSNELRDITE